MTDAELEAQEEDCMARGVFPTPIPKGKKVCSRCAVEGLDDGGREVVRCLDCVGIGQKEGESLWGFRSRGMYSMEGWDYPGAGRREENHWKLFFETGRLGAADTLSSSFSTIMRIGGPRFECP